MHEVKPFNPEAQTEASVNDSSSTLVLPEPEIMAWGLFWGRATELRLLQEAGRLQRLSHHGEALRENKSQSSISVSTGPLVTDT